jgi:pimeloyl-ACP methyl ester carboxylesterase
MAHLLDLAAMADDVYLDLSAGPQGWTRHNARAPLGGLTGFFGASYQRRDTLVVAFRGSEKPGDDFFRDWLVNDLAIASRWIPIPQIAEAEIFARDAVLAARPTPRHIVIVGHSLGGALAQVTAGNMGGSLGVTFNAPGVRDHAWAYARAWANESQVLNLRVQGDPVSRFGRHVGRAPLVLANSNAPTTSGTAVRVLQGIAHGLFVGLQTGSPQVGLAMGLTGGIGGAVMQSAQAHLMNAVLASLRNNPLARRSPATLLAES